MPEKSSQNKPWFQKWWGVLFLILFIPFSLVAFIWPTKMKLPVKAGITAAVVLFALFFYSSMGNTPPKSNNDGQVAGVSETKSSSKQSSKQESKKVEQKPKTVKERVNDLVANKGGWKSSYTDGVAVFTFDTNAGTYWDDKNILEDMIENFIKLGQDVKNIAEVKETNVIYKSKLIDRFGNETPGDLMSITMEMSQFKKFKFENIPSDKIYNFLDDEAIIMILPSTRQKIDFSKITISV